MLVLFYWYIGLGTGDPFPLNNMKMWRVCEYRAIEHLPEFPAIYLITRTPGVCGYAPTCDNCRVCLRKLCELLCVELMMYQFTIIGVTLWHQVE